MFWRRRTSPLTIDASIEVYTRWLHAQRPPWPWFATLSADEQEALAAAGAAYLEDLAVLLGYAIRDPSAADATLEAKAGDESSLASQLAAELAGRIMAGRPEPASRAVVEPKIDKPTMSGTTTRSYREKKAPTTPRSFLGTPSTPKP